MIFDPPLSTGTLVKRYKRFLADVRTTDGQPLTIHCPNTGAMTGVSAPGSEVWFSESFNPKRKYRHTLEVVCSDLGRAGVNTLSANALVREALNAGSIDNLTDYAAIQAEAPIPNSKGRLDFRLTAPDRPDCLVEVKNMTLAYAGGRGAFPDAVSERGLRHLAALREACDRGDRAVLLFCVQHSGIEVATPADEIHPAYGDALRSAAASGVEILAWRWHLTRSEISLDRRLPVDLR